MQATLPAKIAPGWIISNEAVGITPKRILMITNATHLFHGAFPCSMFATNFDNAMRLSSKHYFSIAEVSSASQVIQEVPVC